MSFMPVHGEYRMQKIHADLCVIAMERQYLLIMSNGDVLALQPTLLGSQESFNAYISIKVDGNRIGESAAVQDRETFRRR